MRITVGLPTPRCVVPTRAHEELPADPRVLRTLAADHRIALGRFGNQPCAGAYAEVDQRRPDRGRRGPRGRRGDDRPGRRAARDRPPPRGPVPGVTGLRPAPAGDFDYEAAGVGYADAPPPRPAHRRARARRARRRADRGQRRRGRRVLRASGPPRRGGRALGRDARAAARAVSRPRSTRRPSGCRSTTARSTPRWPP